jgi:hypothetical protein
MSDPALYTFISLMRSHTTTTNGAKHPTDTIHLSFVSMVLSIVVYMSHIFYEPCREHY